MDKTVENNDILEQMFDTMLTFVHFCNKMFRKWIFVTKLVWGKLAMCHSHGLCGYFIWDNIQFS